MVVADDLIKEHGLIVANVAGAILGACRIQKRMNTDATNKELASRLKLSVPTISRSVKVLVDAGEIRTTMITTPTGSERRICLNDRSWVHFQSQDKK